MLTESSVAWSRVMLAEGLTAVVAHRVAAHTGGLVKVWLFAPLQVELSPMSSSRAAARVNGLNVEPGLRDRLRGVVVLALEVVGTAVQRDDRTRRGVDGREPDVDALLGRPLRGHGRDRRTPAPSCRRCCTTCSPPRLMASSSKPSVASSALHGLDQVALGPGVGLRRPCAAIGGTNVSAARSSAVSQPSVTIPSTTYVQRSCSRSRWSSGL